jgi:hypothetical protein
VAYAWESGDLANSLVITIILLHLSISSITITHHLYLRLSGDSYLYVKTPFSTTSSGRIARWRCSGLFFFHLNSIRFSYSLHLNDSIRRSLVRKKQEQQWLVREGQANRFYKNFDSPMDSTLHDANWRLDETRKILFQCAAMRIIPQNTILCWKRFSISKSLHISGLEDYIYRS